MNMAKIYMVLCFVLLTVAGCGPQPTPPADTGKAAIEIQDDMGRQVQLPGHPQRVVVLSASFLEPFHAVGGEVVGRPDSRTKLPDIAKDAASVGAV